MMTKIQYISDAGLSLILVDLNDITISVDLLNTSSIPYQVFLKIYNKYTSKQLYYKNILSTARYSFDDKKALVANLICCAKNIIELAKKHELDIIVYDFKSHFQISLNDDTKCVLLDIKDGMINCNTRHFCVIDKNYTLREVFYPKAKDKRAISLKNSIKQDFIESDFEKEIKILESENKLILSVNDDKNITIKDNISGLLKELGVGLYLSDIKHDMIDYLNWLFKFDYPEINIKTDNDNIIINDNELRKIFDLKMYVEKQIDLREHPDE